MKKKMFKWQFFRMLRFRRPYPEMMPKQGNRFVTPDILRTFRFYTEINTVWIYLRTWRSDNLINIQAIWFDFAFVSGSCLVCWQIFN